MYVQNALILGPPTFALLAVHLNGPAIAIVADSITDAQFMPYISDVTADGTPVSAIDPAHYLDWCLKPYRYSLARSGGLLPDEALLERSKLAIARINAIHRIIFQINRVRARIQTGLALQETVYLGKKMQAEQFKNTGYDESLLIKFPYVLQYADQASLSARQAADDIIFRASLDDAFLSKTEVLRMKYFDLVKNTVKLEEFPTLLSQFFYDCNFKQLV